MVARKKRSDTFEASAGEVEVFDVRGTKAYRIDPPGIHAEVEIRPDDEPYLTISKGGLAENADAICIRLPISQWAMVAECILELMQDFAQEIADDPADDDDSDGGEGSDEDDD